MRRSPKIDINDFYQLGYSSTLVIREHYDPMAKAIKEMEWIKDPRGVYNKIPTWTRDIVPPTSENRHEQEMLIGKQTLELCPKEITDQLRKLINDPRVMGTLLHLYELELDFVDVWNGVETTVGWHWDGPCQSDIISLIYFNKVGLTADYGGGLEVGVRDIVPDTDWLKEYSDIQSLEIIPPSGRTQAWVNNSNPRFVHRPLPLADPNTERLTMTFGCSLKPKV